jgi:hypothetical protein
MAILNKIQSKYSMMWDIAILSILMVTQSLLHEASHALAVIMLGGEVDTIEINAFNPEQSYVAYQLAYSDYAELYQAIIKLLPHVLLGIVGFYLVHTGINRLKLAGQDTVDKYPPLFIGLLYLGIGLGWFLPLKYLHLRSSLLFDIPQAALHLANFVHLYFPEWTLFLNNLSAQFQMRLLLIGLIGLSGLIYGGLRLTLGQGRHTLAGLHRGAAVGFEKDRREGRRVFQLPGR